MGWLGRKHGLQANALTAVEIVTADGELRRIDHDNETDLFWAVRGGGGNYGVVTALEFDLFAAPEIYAGALFFPFERAPRGHARLARARLGRPARRDHDRRAGVPVPAARRSCRSSSAASRSRSSRPRTWATRRDGAELIRPLTELGPDMNTFGDGRAGARSATSPWTRRTRSRTRARRGSSANVSAGDDRRAARLRGPRLAVAARLSRARARWAARCARRPEGAGARATLRRRLPDVRRRRRDEPGGARRGSGPGRRRRGRRSRRGTRALATRTSRSAPRTPALFYDEDTFRLLRALRTEWDPSGLFLANHEIKDA